MNKGVLTHCQECNKKLISTKGARFEDADRGGFCPDGHGFQAGEGR